MQWIVPHTNWLFSFISLALLSWSTDNDYDGHSTSLYGITSRTYIYLFVWTIKIVIYRSRNFCSLQLQALSIWMNWKKNEKRNKIDEKHALAYNEQQVEHGTYVLDIDIIEAQPNVQIIDVGKRANDSHSVQMREKRMRLEAGKRMYGWVSGARKSRSTQYNIRNGKMMHKNVSEPNTQTRCEAVWNEWDFDVRASNKKSEDCRILYEHWIVFKAPPVHFS